MGEKYSKREPRMIKIYPIGKRWTLNLDTGNFGFYIGVTWDLFLCFGVTIGPFSIYLERDRI